MADISEDMECLCHLMKTVGSQIDVAKARVRRQLCIVLNITVVCHFGIRDFKQTLRRRQYWLTMNNKILQQRTFIILRPWRILHAVLVQSTTLLMALSRFHDDVSVWFNHNPSTMTFQKNFLGREENNI